MIEYIFLLLLALLSTVIIETAVAWLFKLRSKREIRTVILINIITNPLLNYLILVNAYFQLIAHTFGLVLVLEVCTGGMVTVIYVPSLQRLENAACIDNDERCLISYGVAAVSARVIDSGIVMIVRISLPLKGGITHGDGKDYLKGTNYTTD